MQRVIQTARHFVLSATKRRQQIGAPDITDEQRVAGQHCVRRNIS